MSMNTELLSPESRAVIEQTRSYLAGVVVDVVIESADQKAGAAALGNEMQKKRTEVEKQRKAEKSVWDEKGRQVQAEFMPVISEFDEKKSILARSIQRFDQQQERRRIEAQAKADAEAARILEKLENAAGTAKEKAQALLSEANRLTELAQAAPEDDRVSLIGQVNKLNRRAKEWLAKAEIKEQQAQAVVPEIVPETPQKVAGIRTPKDAEVKVIDMYAFIAYCIEQKCAEAYLTVNDAALKRAMKAVECKITMPGISARMVERVGFSGR